MTQQEPNSTDEASIAINKLLQIMSRLRDPDNGCPWDLEQDFRSIVPHTLEEAYEVAEAIESADFDSLKDELGDLLFQVVFYAQLAREQQRFDFAAITRAIAEKLERRHPHVFGDLDIRDAQAQTEAWESYKASERQAQAGTAPLSALHGVSRTLPALTRAAKLQRRAARVGFDWPDAAPVRDKVFEELDELDQARERGEPADVREEAGDLLFACVNLLRHLEVDPEQALRAANRKFQQRFEYVERALTERGSSCARSSLDEMEQLWQQAKQNE